MKIAFIGALTGLGGIQRTTSVVASALATSHHITYIDYRGDDSFRYSLHDTISQYDISTVRNRGSLMNNRDKLRDKYSNEIETLVNLLSNIDIAIFCGSFCTALIPPIKAKLAHLQTIAWQKSSYENYITTYTEKYRDEYLLGMSLANAAVCLSPSDISGFSTLNHNTFCISNPLGLVGSEQHDPYANTFLYLGRNKIETKGLDLLIEAFISLNSEWKLHIAVDQITPQLKQLCASEKIILSTCDSDADIIQYYMSSSVYISSSRWEGFGVTMLEAMSFGLPVVATPTVGAKHILNAGEYGLITNSFSPADIKHIMDLISNDNTLRQELSNMSLQRYKDFSINSILLQWEDILNESFNVYKGL